MVGNRSSKKGRFHPGIEIMRSSLEQGKTSRREFLRTVTLLGVSASSAYKLASEITGESIIESAMAEDVISNSGGILRVSMGLPKMDDPAVLSWIEISNVLRHSNEFLTCTGPDNITRPYLAESWEASDDLTQWTFRLRQGIKWHNGDEFTADDVVFNIARWLDPALGSSNIGLFSSMVESIDSGEKDEEGNPLMTISAIDGAVTKIDEYTVLLKLKQPVLSIPENFYNYPTMILHRDFDGDSAKPFVGTGPYTLAEFSAGNHAILKRIGGEYWGKNLNDPYIGGPIYLDEIHYFDHGSASTSQLAAIASDQVDMIYEYDDLYAKMAESITNATIYSVDTAQTGLVRMKVSTPPFDNIKLRQAVQACIDTSVFSEIVFRGNALEGEHHHVAPIHPEYFDLPVLVQDYEKAKELLVEAGYPDGLELTIVVGNTNGPWQQSTCELIAKQLEPVGIKLHINVVQVSEYWENWKTEPFGLTFWTHRPLGTMVLSLAYRTGVPWNETDYSNLKFEAALDKAESLIDTEKRRIAMADVQTILQEDAILIQPVWLKKLFLAKNHVKGLNAHPTQYHQFHKVWINFL